MTLAPKDYITERRREIFQRIEALNGELMMLDRMESALLAEQLPIVRQDGVAPRPLEIAAPIPVPVERKRRRRIAQGIKGLVMEALAQRGPLTANQIIIAVNEMNQISLVRTSLSPQLTRLKKDGKVKMENSIWSLTNAGLRDVL